MRRSSWLDPAADLLAWFGLPYVLKPEEYPVGLDPIQDEPYPLGVEEKLRIRALDLEFCRKHYRHYRNKQKKNVPGQGELF